MLQKSGRTFKKVEGSEAGDPLVLLVFAFPCDRMHGRPTLQSARGSRSGSCYLENAGTVGAGCSKGRGAQGRLVGNLS